MRALRATPPESSLATGVAVATEGLSLDRGGVRVLDDVSFTVPAGTATAVIGPNGSGKTSLLLALTGLLRPAAGAVRTPPGTVTAYVQQHRDNQTWLPLTVREVVTMGRYGARGYLRRLTPHDRALIAAAAGRLEVGDLMRRQFGELSGGQRQRVLLAQALVQEPTVLLLDEPITGLDLASQQRILDLIEEATAEGTTVLITTHNLDEARHCHQVLLLAGRLVAAGSPDEVLQPGPLRTAFGDRLLGDHAGHAHGGDLLMIDDHGHDH